VCDALDELVKVAAGLLGLIAFDEEDLEVFAAVSVLFHKLRDFNNHSTTQFVEHPSNILDRNMGKSVFDVQSNRHD
jgi:hypothetical protein